MFKTMTEASNAILDAAKSGKPDLRDCSAIQFGKKGHQGDVYVHRIKAVPAAWNVEVSLHRQVALGQTMGSRHVADGPALKVLWPQSKAEANAQCPLPSFFPNAPDVREACLGPVVVADEPWTLTHPEHGHHQFPAGVFLVTYQASLATRRQVQD